MRKVPIADVVGTFQLNLILLIYDAIRKLKFLVYIYSITMK